MGRRDRIPSGSVDLDLEGIDAAPNDARHERGREREGRRNLKERGEVRRAMSARGSEVEPVSPCPRTALVNDGAAKLLVGDLPESGFLNEIPHGEGALSVPAHDDVCHVREIGENGIAHRIVFDRAYLSLLQNVRYPPPVETAQTAT